MLTILLIAAGFAALAMMAQGSTFKQEGAILPYTNPSSSAAITVDTVIELADGVGIAIKGIAASGSESLSLCGVHELAAASADVWEFRDRLYWDPDNECLTNVQRHGYWYAGLAAAAKASGAVRATVSLNQHPAAVGPFEVTYGSILSSGEYQGTREESDTQNYALGTKREYADGRKFRYAQARTALHTEFAAGYAAKTIACAVAPAQATGAGSEGDSKVTITVADTDGLAGDGAVAANELVGGYVVIGNGTSQHPQNRMIVANTVAASNKSTLTLDEPLTEDVTVGTTKIETLMNPWILSDMYVTNSAYVTARGMPAREITIDYFGWIQTAGPVWITSDGNTCDSEGDRQIYITRNGSCISGNDVTGDVNVQQLAGHAIDMSGSNASNAPFVNLCLEVS